MTDGSPTTPTTSTTPLATPSMRNPRLCRSSWAEPRCYLLRGLRSVPRRADRFYIIWACRPIEGHAHTCWWTAAQGWAGISYERLPLSVTGVSGWVEPYEGCAMLRVAVVDDERGEGVTRRQGNIEVARRDEANRRSYRIMLIPVEGDRSLTPTRRRRCVVLRGCRGAARCHRRPACSLLSTKTAGRAHEQRS